MYVHRGLAIQKGRGIGGILKGAYRLFAPLFRATVKRAPKMMKKMLSSTAVRQIKKTVKKVAIKQAKGLAGDILRGDNVKAASKRRLQEAKKTIISSIGRQVTEPKAKKKKPNKEKINNQIKKGKKGAKRKKNLKKINTSNLFLTERRHSLI